MIIRFRRRPRRVVRASSERVVGPLRRCFNSFRAFAFGTACLGTLYWLSDNHRLDVHFARVTAHSRLYFSFDPSSTNTALLQQETSFDPVIRDSLLNIRGISPETVWDSLLEEGSFILASSPDQDLIAMEVGMYRALQCVQAAKAGLSAHCVEPSPINFQRVSSAVSRAPPEIQSRIHLYQKAAGATSGDMLNFSASGGTGDHVGEFDPWNMKVGRTKDAALASKEGAVVQVESIKVDDMLYWVLGGDDDRVFLLKVDTQGYEPSVFAGLEEFVFRRQQIDYILFEYWPKGMDLLASTGEDGSVVTKSCIAAGILEKLQKAGYTLYALSNSAHPQAPHEAIKALRQEHAPLENATAYCEYYYELEERFPSKEYRMGYWSDILAVSPDASSIKDAVTAVGRILQQQKRNIATAIPQV